eukprot:4835559-Amphidinium_carterae.1
MSNSTRSYFFVCSPCLVQHDVAIFHDDLLTKLCGKSIEVRNPSKEPPDSLESELGRSADILGIAETSRHCSPTMTKRARVTSTCLTWTQRSCANRSQSMISMSRPKPYGQDLVERAGLVTSLFENAAQGRNFLSAKTLRTCADPPINHRERLECAPPQACSRIVTERQSMEQRTVFGKFWNTDKWLPIPISPFQPHMATQSQRRRSTLNSSLKSPIVG